MSDKSIQEAVKEKYGAAAKQVAAGKTACCGGGATLSGCEPITRNLYDDAEKSGLPVDAVAASLGCGNPTALAQQLQAREKVLDLGSGGGIEVLLSAKRVGPTGKAYSLDVTDEMLAPARENQRKAGVQNVEFLKGAIEAIPLPDNSVDVIISNCVINLSGDKDRVIREAFRVLKPGSRFAVSDVVIRGEVPAETRKSMELWVGCIAGALQESEYLDKLRSAGFESVDIEPTRIYQPEEARDFLTAAGLDANVVGPQIENKFISAFVRVIKPAACDCPPGCVDLPCCHWGGACNRPTTFSSCAPVTLLVRFWQKRSYGIAASRIFMPSALVVTRPAR
jgi:arsenite methyltransferase